jgi:hypothetical protein
LTASPRITIGEVIVPLSKSRKEIDMIHTSRRLLLGTLLATSSAIAAAQAPAPVAEAPTPMQQRMAERHDQRMADLKSQLKITPAQEPAWSAFTATMKPPAQAARMNRGELNNLTTPQRIDLMQERAAKRQAWMKERGDAVKTFYAQLSPEQQKIFDARAARFGQQGQQGQRGGMRRGPGQ